MKERIVGMPHHQKRLGGAGPDEDAVGFLRHPLLVGLSLNPRIPPVRYLDGSVAHPRINDHRRTTENGELLNPLRERHGGDLLTERGRAGHCPVIDYASPEVRHRKMLRTRATFAFLFATACGGSEPSDTHVPELGRYLFGSRWSTDPSDVTNGELVIHTAHQDSLTYTITLAELGGPRTKSGTALWGELNDYIILSPSISRDGSWTPIPHLKRAGGEYSCYGNIASITSTGVIGLEMTCSFTYLGP